MFKNKYLRLIVDCGVVALASAFLTPALAAEFPERPVRIVVEFPAGGASDVVARRVAAKLRDRLGQTIVIDNRAGAGGEGASRRDDVFDGG